MCLPPMSACRLGALRCWAGSLWRRRRQCCLQEVTCWHALSCNNAAVSRAVHQLCAYGVQNSIHVWQPSALVNCVLQSLCCLSRAHHISLSCAAAQELGCPLVLAPDDVQFSAAPHTEASSNASSSSSSPVPALLWQQARMALSGQTAAVLVAPGEPAELGKPHGV